MSPFPFCIGLGPLGLSIPFSNSYIGAGAEMGLGAAGGICLMATYTWMFYYDTGTGFGHSNFNPTADFPRPDSLGPNPGYGGQYLDPSGASLFRPSGFGFAAGAASSIGTAASVVANSAYGAGLGFAASASSAATALYGAGHGLAAGATMAGNAAYGAGLGFAAGASSASNAAYGAGLGFATGASVSTNAAVGAGLGFAAVASAAANAAYGAGKGIASGAASSVTSVIDW
jgi:hypothetical protein